MTTGSGARRLRRVATISGLAVCGGLLTAAGAAYVSLPVSSRGKAEQIFEAAHGPPARAPLVFEPNHGQFGAPAAFLTRGRDHAVFLVPTGIVMAVAVGPGVAGDATTDSDGANRAAAGAEATAAGGRAGRRRLALRFLDADPNPRIDGLRRLPGHSSYLIGGDPAMWQARVPRYAEVAYHDVYQGVDVLFHGRRGMLEYDFVLAPGVQPGVIRLGIEGAAQVSIDDRGDLVLRAGETEVRQLLPAVYQEGRGERTILAARYVLEDAHQVRIDVEGHDPSLPLVIDPILSFSTYLGGSGFDNGQGVAVDGDGNIYVVGTTFSGNFPTANAFQGEKDLSTDVLITKLDPSGTTALYSTYLGGSGADNAIAVAVDHRGNAYITGSTSSTDFPLRPTALECGAGGDCPLDETMVGTRDGFVAMLEPDGSDLVYSTYLGGSDFEAGLGIAVDREGNSYVTGNTESTDFPTENAFQATLSSVDPDAYVSKIAPDGQSFVYSTYLGGSGNENGLAVDVDDSGDAYVVGATTSSDFPTVNPFDGDLSGTQDWYLARLSSSGSTLVYSTYVGGGGSDRGTTLAVGGPRRVHVGGSASSVDFPTKNAFDGVSGGDDSAFVTIDTSTGGAASLLQGSYLGGSDGEFGVNVAVDSAGSIFVYGDTQSTDFPTRDAIQPVLQGTRDVFVAKLAPNGSTLVYSTYFGGSDIEFTTAFGSGAAADRRGNVYVVGRTQSTDFPTANAFQPDHGGGGQDAFVVKLSTALDFWIAGARETGRDGVMRESSTPHPLPATPR